MTERVLAIIEANPGVSSFGIRRELLRTSRATHYLDPRYWFGPKASWRMWIALENLEEAGLVRAEWGPASEPDFVGYRRRHYWAT